MEDNAQTAFSKAVAEVKAGGDAHQAANGLLAKLTPDEKLALLHGDSSFWQGMLELYTDVYTKRPYPHGTIARLGIPGVQYCDGPRGVNVQQGTAFPCSMARGSTWDPLLEEKVGLAIGREARLYGANMVGSVCINLPRHPAWGRVQETYSEDPLLLGEFGAAHVRGLQRNVMACVKHYALNSMETARFRVNVDIDEAALHEAFLPHFRRCVDEGALSVMTAYNSVNGHWAGESPALIRDILRKDWGFDGIVITDWLFGLRDGPKSIDADLDIEAPFRNIRAASLKPALETGRLRWSAIERIASRILRNQVKLYAIRDHVEPPTNVVFNDEHRRLAHNVATRSIVLLKNNTVEGNPILPLPYTMANLAVIGRHADSPLTGDRASSWVNCPEMTTPLGAIRAMMPNTTIHVSASDSPQDGARAASQADAALVIVGYDGHDEGEFLKPSQSRDAKALALFPQPDGSSASNIVQKARAKARAAEKACVDASASHRPEGDLESRPRGGDRSSVRLRAQDVDLIRAVSAANPRTIVSIITAGAVITEEWRHLVPGVLISWYNGYANGSALAEVLLGAVNPSGRLPWAMPTTEAHLPLFDADADQVTYDKWFGQRMLDKMGVKAAYPLGYGLSYTRFQLKDASLTHQRGTELIATLDASLRVTVTNAGDRPGWCVVQVYARPDFGPGPHDFPNRVLVGFKAIEVGGKEFKTVSVAVSLQPLLRWRDGRFSAEAKRVTFEVGQYAGDPSGLIVRGIPQPVL
ncbi:glycoside hydrolase superfamily [Plectosphaerella plurivora]|uniref:beta-glucosidase n=1 Tax=Plectosphaerella plurivora TaxID=936078 RepID=A0A9P8UVH7_9PEZI|nr:glycoside hydrolase superfamily [Plectosphaerella plurivora]